MKFLEWLKPETAAIKATAVYFGVPGQGHPSCYMILTHKNWTGSLEQVTRSEPDIEKKHCIECGKLLLMPTSEQARKAVVEWAKQHFDDELVEVLEISYDTDEMNWEAELEVSTSADNPTIVFFIDDLYGFQSVSIEY